MRAYWRFPKGTLATFLQDDMGCGVDLDLGIRTVIAKTDVTVSRFGLPLVRLRKPLRAGDPRDPLEREMLVFWPQQVADGVPIVKLTREPPWIAEGRRIERWGVDVASSVTTSLGVTVSAAGPAKYEQDIDRKAQEIAESLVPLA